MSTFRKPTPTNRTPAIPRRLFVNNPDPATVLGAEKRPKTNNSFVLNKNPNIEHTNFIDFAPKVTVSLPIPASFRPPCTIPCPTYLHPSPKRHIIKPLTQEATTCARWR